MSTWSFNKVNLVIWPSQVGQLTKSTWLFYLSQPGHLSWSKWKFNMVNFVIWQGQPSQYTKSKCAFNKDNQVINQINLVI